MDSETDQHYTERVKEITSRYNTMKGGGVGPLPAVATPSGLAALGHLPLG